MALPKLVHPTKKIKIPSKNIELNFEPFTTQDEKAIILLDEKASLYDKAKIQQDILKKCCQDEFDFSSLSSVEIMYLFLQLRKISVGGTIDLMSTCPKCKNKVKVSIDINSVEFDASKLAPLTFTVQTSDGPYIITCTPIRTDDLQYINTEEYKFDDVAVILRTMMKPDGNDVIELTQEEKIELFNQLDTQTVQKMAEYLNNTPSLEKHIYITCTECEHQYEGELRDFFI